MENEQEILNKFMLSEDAIAEIVQKVFDRLTFEKTPQENPIAIVIGGQPGAGKTGLIDKTIKEIDNSIILDVDDYRYFHPQIERIFVEYPDLLVPLTKETVNAVSRKVVELLQEKKYNLVIHKTLKDDEIIYDTLIPLQKAGYTIVIRAIAVCDLESRMSSLERSLAFKTRVGWCRWVTKENHTKAYEGLPVTAKQIYDSEYCDAVQIFKRNIDPTDSVLVYSNKKDESEQKINQSLKLNKELKIEKYNVDKFVDCDDAIDKTRDEERQRIVEGVFKRLEIVRGLIQDETDSKYVDEVKELADEYFAKYNNLDGEYMNNNTKLELSKEIMARMIAIKCKDGFNPNDPELILLLEEEQEMNKFNESIINKIIKVYGPLVKNGDK